MQVRAYIGLGGNLGDILANFHVALAALSAGGARVSNVSRAFRTRALRRDDDTATAPMPDFYNAVCEVHTALKPQELLELMLRIEQQVGRVRSTRWASRTLDLDLLLYGDELIHDGRLRVPHPEMSRRAFVLQPLAEIARECRVPPHGISVAELLHALTDPCDGILGAVPLQALCR